MDISVGVFCDDREEGLKFILNKIGGRQNALRIVNTLNGWRVETPMCHIKWVGPHSNARGYRFHYAYVHEGWVNRADFWTRVLPYIRGGWTAMPECEEQTKDTFDKDV